MVKDSYEIIIGRDPEDIEKYGKEGTIFIGKHLVGEGEAAHLTNNIRMDVARPHVVLIAGKRGTGKSYSLGVIVEEISQLPREIKQNLSVLIVDTMGVFWSMKNPNERDIELISKWGIQPKGFDVSVIVPEGQKKKYDDMDIPYDVSFTIRPSELTAQDWSLVFGFKLTDTFGILLERILKRLNGEYTIDDIISMIEVDEKSERIERLALMNKFEASKAWGIFGSGSGIDSMIQSGKISVLDLSYFGGGSPISALLLGIINNKIYESRIAARRIEEQALMSGENKRVSPLTWIIIDEAHVFIPSDSTTPASDSLRVLLRQGRQPGIGLVLATQRPYKLHEDAFSQADILISHRVTAKQDVDSLSAIMQTYLISDIKKLLDSLPRLKGTALILDDNSERIYTTRIRPRQSWHAGGTPTALKEKIV